MKNILIISICLLAFSTTNINAQTTAKNWTATDCNGTSHTLFDELDSGKVVIMFFEMGCGSCVSGGTNMESKLTTLMAAHPNMFNVYYMDYNIGSTCSDINTWINTNSLSSVFPTFANAGAIMQPYGSGMPLIVMVSGTDHKVMYKSGWNATNFNKAAGQALSRALGISENENLLNEIEIQQTNDNLFITSKNNIRQKMNVKIYDMSGKIIFSNNNFQSSNIDIKNFAEGMYIINISCEEKSCTKKIFKY